MISSFDFVSERVESVLQECSNLLRSIKTVSDIKRLMYNRNILNTDRISVSIGNSGLKNIMEYDIDDLPDTEKIDGVVIDRYQIDNIRVISPARIDNELYLKDVYITDSASINNAIANSGFAVC
ncbi:hypothetical protein [Lachnospira multipara]|uniref:hypothetical protein n=1 Tax=Lachnospira multipara TaxID=28051 RepID=UPI0004871947|nr:hypothetical protein [Lachnospira multipara]